jgi:hypothetical protein
METRLDITVGPEVETGVYANFASVWHTPDSFVLDFAVVLGPPGPGTDAGTGEALVAVPARVVSRVRIPPQQVFELMKALEQQLTSFEKETGKRPGAGAQPLD